MPAEVIKTEKLLDCDIFEVRKATIREEGTTYTRDVIVHPGSAVVVPYFEDGTVALVRQYRHPAGKALLELPAGSIDDGESALECARREIREETGFRAESFRLLTEFWVSPGFLSEKMYVFLATGLTEDPAAPDDDEFLTVERRPLAEWLEMVASGSFEDAKTMLGLVFAGKALNIGS